jgi:hypothetical protein
MGFSWRVGTISTMRLCFLPNAVKGKEEDEVQAQHLLAAYVNIYSGNLIAGYRQVAVAQENSVHLASVQEMRQPLLGKTSNITTGGLLDAF